MYPIIPVAIDTYTNRDVINNAERSAVDSHEAGVRDYRRFLTASRIIKPGRPER